MSAPASGRRLALAYMPILLGLVTLAMTLPATAMFGRHALYMIVPGFGLVAAGLIMLLLLIRPRRD